MKEQSNELKVKILRGVEQPTLRDLFAMAALAGFCGQISNETFSNFEGVAIQAYDAADAMMKQRRS